MTARNIIEECRQRGVTLAVKDNRLQCYGPRKVVNELLETLKVHKTEILDHLTSDFDEQIQAVIEELNRDGIRMMDFPEATRNRALPLEEALTEAASRGDRALFLGLLSQWKECFH